MERIALFLPNWIGDVVMATPAIRAVREHFPKAELLAVCKPYVAETLAGQPVNDRAAAACRGASARVFCCRAPRGQYASK